jgi:hypothetical protein
VKIRLTRIVLASLATLAVACVGGGMMQGDADPEIVRACGRFNPVMQTKVLEAVVQAGGPLVVDVDGWMCGRSRQGLLVRIVVLHYQTEQPEIGRAIVPVVFEGGALVSFGWELLDSAPNRYGVRIDRARWGTPDWDPPRGWAAVRSSRS